MCRKLVLLLLGAAVFCLVGNASGALPAGWSSQDVGTPTAGSADVVGGVWSVSGNGNDIWGGSDNFHFAYLPMSGNCEVTALVTDVGTGTNDWAKGGVMIRETLNGNSANSCVMLTPGNGGGLTFQIRPTAGAGSTSEHTQAPTVTPPHWVRVRRIGDTFTGWRSPDGVTWTQQGSDQTVVMAEDVYVGIAVTSHEDGAVRTMTFENVTAEPIKFATEPTPADGVELTKRSTTLAWEPGFGAESHDVYFGSNRDDVIAGIGGTFRGNQSADFVFVGFAGGIIEQPLDLGTTYYWRIDEVEADGTKHVGPVWSFSVPSAKAQNPGPADGARFVDPEAQLTWDAGFESIFHTVYIGDDFDTVLNATDGGTQTGDPFFDLDEPLEAGKTYYWRVDEFDLSAVTHKGDVWSFTVIPDIPITDPNLVAWWQMNEGEGARVIDWSGYGHHADMEGSPQWVAGYDAGGIQLNGNPDAIVATGYQGVGRYDRDDQIPFTVTAWINRSANGEIVAWGADGGGQRMEFRVDGGRLRCEHGSGNVRGDTDIPTGQWHHVAMTCPRGGALEDITFYVDGLFDPFRQSGDPSDPMDTGSGNDVKIGRRHYETSRYMTGLFDDVRIYDRMLTQEEIQEIMLRPDPYVAWAPNPARGGEPQIEEISQLSWSPGDKAVQHDVYFGTSQAAVESADTGSPEYKGRQSSMMYSLAGMIEFGGGPYYWRIDEINDDGTMTTGRTWDFSIANYVLIDDMEDYNNFSPDTIWEAWADGFGNPSNGSQVGYDLGPTVDAGEFYVERNTVRTGNQSMPLFYNNTGVTSEATLTLTGLKRNWTRHDVQVLQLWYNGSPGSLGSFTEDPAGTFTMTAAGADIWGTADQFHYAWKMLNGAGSITAKIENLTETNTWTKAGVMIRNTLDPNSANAMTLVAFNNSRVRLQYRGDAAGTSSGTGDVQNITILPRWLKIERTVMGDFVASHANDVGGNPGTWEELASITVAMNPNVYIGLALTSHSVGNQATAKFSNVSTTGTVTGAWQNQDIGIQSNDLEQMYVKITDGSGNEAMVSNPDPNAVQMTGWNGWGENEEGILLSDFVADNPSIDLANVNTVTLGFGPPSGGDGMVFIDDVRLYPSRCVADIAKPAADLSNNCVVDVPDLQILSDDWLVSGYDVTATAATDANLLLHYTFDGNANDSSGNGYHGVVLGDPTYIAGQVGQAISLDGVFDYIAISDVNFASTGNTATTVATWIRTDYEGDQCIASFDRNEYWRLEINGNAAGPGQVGWGIWTHDGQVDFGSKSRIDDGQWHHIAGVFDAGEHLIYIDGVIDAATSVASTFGSGNLRYGFVSERSEATEVDGAKNAPPWRFQGEMDDLRIYERALAAGEIANLAGAAAGSVVTQPAQAFMSTAEDSDLVDDEKVDFMDYAILIDSWLDEQLWP